MPTKRDIIELLRRDELLSIVDTIDLQVKDRRVNEELIDAVVRAKRARLVDILAPLSRDRLKDICVGIGLDDTGREKSVLIDRILGEPSGSEAPERNEDEGTAPSTLTKLLRDSFEPTDVGAAWPARGRLRIGEQAFDVDIYARVIGGSSRGNSLERRFQNPSQQSPIVDDPERHKLLLGLWTEQGEERSVVVAFDAYRRLDRTTRFSLFMPLSLLEQAADTGFSTHENAKGETLYAFRPENVGRYVQALVDAGQWQLQVPVIPMDRPRKDGRKDAQRVVESLSPSTGTDTVYIRPRVGMYAAFARLNYKPWFALAEFLDNSIQSFLHRRDELVAAGHDGPLSIDVNLDDNEISIVDRAGGISWADFPRAFSPAAPPDDASGLSEFGLGMKAAACWFSRKWTVRTSALGEPVERLVSFDIPKISRDGVETLPIETRPARESDHFTVITLNDLRVHPRGRTLSKIKDHLSSIYRVLMKEGVVTLRLTTGGRAEDLQYEHPELLQAPHYKNRQGPVVLWRKEFAVEFNERKVTGWAGIMKSGSHANAGFSVFRRRRLVEGSVGETYKPHNIFGSPNSFASQRIVGEMFVEGFDVTHTKDGIQWHGYEEEILEAVRQQLDAAPLPLLEQADGYRARKTAVDLPENFGVKALAGTAHALSRPAAALAIREDVVATPDIEPHAPDPEQPVPVLQRKKFRLQVMRDEKPWVIHLELVSDRASPFYSTAMTNVDDEDVLSVQLNLDHDFSIAFINNNEALLQPMVRLLAALSLGERIARDGGVKGAGAVRRNANDILNVIASDGVMD